MSEVLGQIPAGTQMIIAFFVLMAIGMPVAFALGLSALYAMWVIGFGFDLAGDLIAAGIAKYSLLAIPFFILAGSLMGSLGIAERMIRFFRVLIGDLPGGMGWWARSSACSGARCRGPAPHRSPPSARC